VELLLSINESTSGAANDDEVQHSLGIRAECDLDILQCVARAGQLAIPGLDIGAPQIIKDDDPLGEVIIGIDIELTEAEFLETHRRWKTRSLGQEWGDDTIAEVVQTEEGYSAGVLAHFQEAIL